MEEAKGNSCFLDEWVPKVQNVIDNLKKAQLNAGKTVSTTGDPAKVAKDKLAQSQI